MPSAIPSGLSIIEPAGAGTRLASVGRPAKELDLTSPAYRAKLFWRLQCAGWGFSSVLTAVFIATGYFSPRDAFLLGLARNLFGFAVTSGLRYFYRFLRGRSVAVWWCAMWVVLPTGLLGIADGVLTYSVAHWIGADFRSGLLQQFLWGGIFMRWMVYLLWSLLYFGLSFWLDTQHERLRLAEAEAEARASEFRLLRAQINPHFLFNALNSIQAVAGDADKARSLIQSFADYLRFSLEHRRDLQPLGAELDALENYLRVEKARFEERLEFLVVADAEARRTSVPIALVQPLLENAVKYGQRTSPWPLRIQIRASVQSGRLQVVVTNSGKWCDAEESGSTRIGLKNLRRRLDLLFGSEASLQVTNGEGEVEVTVEIPVREEADK